MMEATRRKPGQDAVKIAVDRSARHLDANGYLHVDRSNISKAAVNPYYGNEIPDGEELGLDPDKVYFLLRDPVELAKAAQSSNKIPLLDNHEPVDPDNIPESAIAGTTGTEGEFVAPFLQNSLTVWRQSAIDEIDSKDKAELSCGYRYTIDLTAGEFGGVAYDGVMRNISFNHVALVDVGRAGPDVVVGDSQPKEGPMAKQTRNFSPKAAAVYGTLLSAISPRLAQDKGLKRGELRGMLKGITADSLHTRKKMLGKQLLDAFKPRLAKDANLDDITDLLDQLDDDDEMDDMDETDDKKLGAKDDADMEGEGGEDDGDPIEAVLQFLTGKLDDEDMEEVAQLLQKLGGEGLDESPKGKDGFKPGKPGEKPPAAPAGISKGAMDSALRVAQAKTLQLAQDRFLAIRSAENETEPVIGKLSEPLAQPADYYRLALDQMSVDNSEVPDSAVRSLFRATAKNRATVAQDHDLDDGSAQSDFDKRFGAAARKSLR